MEIEIGQLAPDFSLYNTEKEKVTLSQLRGDNVLLLFFPLAFTSVCTAELCGIRDNMKIYESLHVKPLGISVDSLYTLAKFKQEQNLNFPLLSDFNKTVSKLYGSLYENFGFDMQGVSKRSAFLIDTEGIVRYAEVLENAGKQPDFQALQVKLRELAR
jgi:glutaredoxin-dependent peroxiredoxin